MNMASEKNKQIIPPQLLSNCDLNHLISIRGSESQQVGNGANRFECLDRLVRGAVLAEPRHINIHGNLFITTR
jgi:hypothetical protein